MRGTVLSLRTCDMPLCGVALWTMVMSLWTLLSLAKNTKVLRPGISNEYGSAILGGLLMRKILSCNSGGGPQIRKAQPKRFQSMVPAVFWCTWKSDGSYFSAFAVSLSTGPAIKPRVKLIYIGISEAWLPC